MRQCTGGFARSVHGRVRILKSLWPTFRCRHTHTLRAIMTSPIITLITGANQGLGYHAALQLSKLPGYHVLVGSRDAAKGAAAVKQIEAEGASL
jgi:hypothetical protein